VFGAKPRRRQGPLPAGTRRAAFADRAHLDGPQIASLTFGDAGDPVWTVPRERLLIRAADEMHDTDDLSDRLWAELRAEFDDSQLLDLVLLCGWYRAISNLARAARLAPEPWAPTFAAVLAGGGGQGQAPERAPVRQRGRAQRSREVLPRLTAEPKPVRLATWSTDRLVVASSFRARPRRSPINYCNGVTPVSFRNRRFSVRTLAPACRAMSASVRGSARFSSIQRIVGSMAPPSAPERRAR